MREIKKGNYWHIHDEGMPVSPLDAYRVVDDSCIEKETIQKLEKYYIHEDDLLWYFEVKGSSWSLYNTCRMKRKDLSLKERKNAQILYALGFRIDERRQDEPK